MVPLDAGSPSQKIDESLPSKGRQPKLDEIPGGDQMPGEFCDSVAPQRQILSRPIGQQRGSSPKGAGAFLVTFCANKKLPGSGAGSPGDKRRWLGPGRPYQQVLGAGVRQPLAVPCSAGEKPVPYNPSSSSSHSWATASDGIRLVGASCVSLRPPQGRQVSLAPLRLLSPPRPLCTLRALRWVCAGAPRLAEES